MAGMPGPRKYQIQRNGIPIFTITESGTQTVIGGITAARVAVCAGCGLLSQASPSHIRKISAGTTTPSPSRGFLVRTNPGDQPMYDDHNLPASSRRCGSGLPGRTSRPACGVRPLLPADRVAADRSGRKTTLVQDLTGGSVADGRGKHRSRDARCLLSSAG